jgi:hypothetical protein
MTTHPDFQAELSRIGELLRGAGLSDDNIAAFTEQQLRKASTAELEHATKALAALEGLIDVDDKRTSEAVDEARRLMDRIKQILERLEIAAVSAGPSPRTDGGTKYPNIKVRLDQRDDVGPILRRVSYAMADAGIDDAEIEQYKREVKEANNPVAVARRWVTVE